MFLLGSHKVLRWFGMGFLYGFLRILWSPDVLHYLGTGGRSLISETPMAG